MRKKMFYWGAVAGCLGLLGLCVWFLYRTGFFSALTSAQALEAYIQQFSPFGEAAFFFAQLLSVLIPPIPNNMLALAGGVVFGFFRSFLLTILAIYLGSLLVFLLARKLGRPFVEFVVHSASWEKYLGILRAKHDFFFLLALLLPYFPDDLFCLLMGLTDIPLRRYMVIVILTRPWGLLFASTLGSLVLSLSPLAVIFLVLVGIAVFVLGLKYGVRVEEWLIHLFHRK